MNRGEKPLSKKKTISIIIPAFNEEGNIQGSIDAAVYAASNKFDDYEVIVVNDGSEDQTLSLVKKNIKKNNRIKVISHSENKGFGASFNTGRKNVRMMYTVMVHGDNVFPEDSLSEVFSMVGKTDVVCGYIQNPESRSQARRLISDSFQKFMNILFGMNLKYFNGIQIHKTEWLKNIELKSTGFGFQSELLVKALKQGKTYLEVPYIHVERPGGGATKIFKWKNICSVVRTILHLLFWKPLNNKKKNQEVKND
jgi:glycosyltransferase involved in cell wall biosynthesis